MAWPDDSNSRLGPKILNEAFLQRQFEAGHVCPGVFNSPSCDAPIFPPSRLNASTRDEPQVFGKRQDSRDPLVIRASELEAARLREEEVPRSPDLGIALVFAP